MFHGTNFAVPYLPTRPSVLSLHDLSPWMDPGWHHNADRVRGRTPPLIGLGMATMILTDTEAVRRQAIDYFRIHPDRIVAAPLAASNRFRPAPASQPRHNYFLFVGTLEPRKNIPFLVDAWRPVRDRHGIELVLAGRSREDFPGLSNEPGLRILGESSRPFAERTIDDTSSRNVENWSATGLASSVPRKASRSRRTRRRRRGSQARGNPCRWNLRRAGLRISAMMAAVMNSSRTGPAAVMIA